MHWWVFAAVTDIVIDICTAATAAAEVEAEHEQTRKKVINKEVLSSSSSNFETLDSRVLASTAAFTGAHWVSKKPSAN